MGYLTDYDLTWSGATGTARPCPHCDGKGMLPVDDVVQEFVNTELFLYDGTEPVADSLQDSCKWYDHEDDMKRLSKLFPDVVFTLKGTGEEAGDVWVKYFKDGKVQVDKAEIRLAEFDPMKLA